MANEPLIIERILDAPVSRVWKALIDKNEIKEWSFDIAAFEPEVGFEFQFYGENEGRKFLHLCRVTDVEPIKKLGYTWRYEGQDEETHVTFELEPDGEKTRVRLTHRGLEKLPQDRDFKKENFIQGWTEIIGKSLKNFVEKPTFIEKSVKIKAPAFKVWQVLVNPELTKQWANEFSEGAYVETDWKKGNEVIWKDKEGNVGTKGLVIANEPSRLLDVAFYDDVNATAGTEPGEYKETYVIAEQDGVTQLSIKSGPLAEKYIADFTPLWDKAIGKMKELAEARE